MEGSMGVMFVVKGANKPRINTKYVCPECGSVHGRFYGGRAPCKTCNGLGNDPKDDPIGEFAFEVEPWEAIAILNDLLNYGTHEMSWQEGSLNPTDVLIRLAMSDFRIEAMVRPLFTYVDADVNVCPPEESLRLYVERLTALAEKASEIDEEI